MRLVYSVLDQGITSGGNFLVIAICAHLLSVYDQGKVAYTYATYLAVLLLNVALIFQGAAIKAPAVEKPESYHQMLARLQLLSGLLLSLLATVFWMFLGENFDWEPSVNELAFLFSFLLIQQLADFDRRASYIFSGPGKAALSSGVVYPVRVLMLLLIQPDSFELAVAIWAVTAIIPALFSIKMAITGACETCNYESIIHHVLFSRLLLAGAPLGWLWSFLPIFFLGSLYGKMEVAVFMSVRSIANVANLAMEQLEIQSAAHMARIFHSQGKPALDKAVLQLLAIGGMVWLVGLLVTLYFADAVIGLVLGDNYVQYSEILTISWVAYGVYFFARVHSIARRSSRDMKTEFVGNVAAVMAAIVVGFPLVKYFSVDGAAWGYVVIASSIGLAQALVVRKPVS